MDGIENAQNVQMLDLVRPRRAEDRSEDLFTVANVLQENALRHGIRYTLDSVNRNGRPVTRHMETRRVIETTGTAMEMTGSIWEAAAELLK